MAYRARGPISRRDVTPDQLLGLADQCVKCGLCLPHCPTYAKLGNEADSPRGRIALIQGWASGELSLTPRLAGHLDGCLTCRACEAACPSLVAYGRLSDGARAARIATLPQWRRRLRRAWLRLLSDSRANAWLATAARLHTASGLARLAEWTGIARLPRVAPYHRLSRAIGISAREPRVDRPEAPDLELFVGCSGGLAQGPAVEAVRGLCRLLGLRVLVPGRPLCCGALFRHNGFPHDADRTRATCARPAGSPPLVGLSSACVAELREGGGAGTILELCDYLDRLAPLDRLTPRPLGLRVLVHEPCSHRNLLKETDTVYRLLSRIPGLDARPLPGNATCCGAAGTAMLEQPTMARSLLADKLTTLAELVPDAVVSTNPGCALHLQAGVIESGLPVRVCHPVELLWASVQ